jgi:hypothetical protein
MVSRKRITEMPMHRLIIDGHGGSIPENLAAHRQMLDRELVEHRQRAFGRAGR